MNPIKESQKIKIIPDKIEKISTGVIVSANQNCFIAEVSEPSSVNIGLEPEILISLEDCMVKFTSKVDKIEGNKVFFSISSKFNFIQKREYPRINTNMPVLLNKSNQTQETEAVIVNIGGGGMQVASSCKFNSNCVLNTSFNLSNKMKINTSFEVLRVEREKEKFFLSGKFNNISNFDKTAIIQFCFKRQLELKYKK